MTGLPLQMVEIAQSHLFLISLLHFSAWIYCITINGWVSDDIQGIAAFSDRFHQQKDQQGRILKEEKIDSYDTDQKDKDGKPVKIKNTAWNKSLPFPSNFMRWFRLNWGKTFKEIGKNASGHSVYGWVQDSGRHHLLNILVQWGNLLLGYNLLSHLFGPQVALFSMLLFAVHPCGVQTVGWISGVNYCISLLGALLTFNAAIYIQNPYILFPVIAFTSTLSCMTLLPGCLNFIILIYLGFYNAAIMAGLVGVYFLYRLGKEAVGIRVNAFKEQQMGKSTGLYWRKVIIMVKTFWYYVKMILFPKRLGLFHTWGYHFDEPIEHIDREFWFGFASLITYGVTIWLAPPPVQFGLIWALLYLLIFSNFITAQQFVSERYAYISIFGVSVAAAYYLQHYPIISAFIIGIALMRIWVHLPTFKNEVRFYESNCFNFPDSEVAMGNLGVSYLNHGMHYKAYDTWHEASRQNPLYDVPWYNLYSLSKQNGDILKAKYYLEKCLSAKTIHFPDQWKKELEEIDKIIAQAISDGRLKLAPSSPA